MRAHSSLYDAHCARVESSVKVCSGSCLSVADLERVFSPLRLLVLHC